MEVRRSIDDGRTYDTDELHCGATSASACASVVDFKGWQCIQRTQSPVVGTISGRGCYSVCALQ